MKTRHFIATLALGACLSFAAGVVAQSGYPVRPLFQAVKVGASSIWTTVTSGRINTGGAVPAVGFDETDQAADGRIWNVQVEGGIFTVNACPNSLAGCGRALELIRTGAVMTGAEMNDISILPSDGSMSSSTGTGWASMPTLTGSLKKRGDVVYWTISDGFVTGTSNATTITFTGGIPVGFRPASGRAGGPVLATDNGTLAAGQACMWVASNGDVEFNRATGGLCGSGGTGWTASGVKAIRGSSGFYFAN